MTDKQTLRERRKEMLCQMEQRLRESQPREEDSLFYYHASDDRIVLSHALFWVMTRSLKGKIAKERFLLLLRQYEEETCRKTSAMTCSTTSTSTTTR